MSDCPKVLIADDEQECIDFVRDALADSGCEVLAAADGEQALQAARDHKPRLIILDVQMPKKDGFAVFSELRSDEALRGIPVIMLTAVTERTNIKFSAADMGQYMGSEPEAYIDKPIEPVLLKQVVNRLLKRSSPSA
jgi:CheY-like chemotaxis protein